MTNFNYALNSLGIVITAQNETQGYAKEQAFDGSDVTYAACANNTAYWLAVDLGAPQYIATSRVLGKKATQTANMWALQYSTDGTSWQNVGQAHDGQGDTSRETGGLTARYWRLYYGGSVGSGTGIYTWELIGPIEAPPPPTNPTDDYVKAWLDGINANYKPSVDEWLAENL